MNNKQTEKSLFPMGKGIMPACDVPTRVFKDIVLATMEHETVVGYKIGFYLAITEGLKAAGLSSSNMYIYNHEAGATDIPDTGKKFVEAIKHPGIKGVVFSPLSGPATQQAWTQAAKDEGLKVFIELPEISSVISMKTLHSNVSNKNNYIDIKAVEAMIKQGFNNKVDGFISPSESNFKKYEEVYTSLLKNFNKLYNRRTSDELEIKARNEKGELPDLDKKESFTELKSSEIIGPGLIVLKEIMKLYGIKKPLIYDHQKAGTSSKIFHPAEFASSLIGNVNGAIIFSLAGSDAQDLYTKRLQEAGIEVIVGGVMTHPQFRVSEGGYINDKSILEIYSNAASSGVKNFVLPSTKLNLAKTIKGVIEEIHGVKDANYMFPGVIKQGGSLSDTMDALGPNAVAISGRAIYQNDDGSYKNVNEITKSVQNLTATIIKSELR